MQKSNAQDYFPKNYADSRIRFTDLAQQIKGPKDLGAWKIDSPTDKDLYVDHLWLPPSEQPETLLVLLSGIHGTETYTGAAILNLFLEEMLGKVPRRNLGILIVHAMNPYGFKHHKRCTQNHVNLNRNFSVSGELFKTQNKLSKRLNELILSRKPVSSLQSRLLQSQKSKNGTVYFGDVSLDELSKGIGAGQFASATDLEYGGTKTEPQTQALIEYLRKQMPAFKEIIALDLHTGLGDRGRLHLLTDGQAKSLHPELFKKLFRTEQDQEFYSYTPPETEGFYQVFGASNSMFAELASPQQKVCAVTLEFGTLGHSLDQQVDAFNRFILDHEGQHYGYANSDLEKEIQRLNFDRSYPREAKWQTDVLMAAQGLFQGVLSRITL